MNSYRDLILSYRRLARRAARLQGLWDKLTVPQQRAMLLEFPEVKDWFDDYGRAL